MNKADLIPFIRQIINEASLPDDPFADEMDDTLLVFVRTAMTQLASMPSYQGTPSVLEDKECVEFSARPDGLYYAIIKPREDFLRPVGVNLEGWVRPVFDFQSAIGTPFLRQYSSAPGIGSGPNSPSAFITKDDQRLVIAHAVTEPKGYSLRYIAIPEIEADGTISIPERYHAPLAYTAAGLYMQSINEYDVAKAAFDTAASFIQTINNKTTDQQ